MAGIILFIFLAYLASSAMGDDDSAKKVIVQDVQLQEVKQEEKKEPPPPPPPPKPEPPKVEITKFTPPKIVNQPSADFKIGRFYLITFNRFSRTSIFNQ